MRGGLVNKKSERGEAGSEAETKKLWRSYTGGLIWGAPILELYACRDNRRPSLWPRYTNVDRSPASRAKQGCSEMRWSPTYTFTTLLMSENPRKSTKIFEILAANRQCLVERCSRRR